MKTLNKLGLLAAYSLMCATINAFKHPWVAAGILSTVILVGVV